MIVSKLVNIQNTGETIVSNDVLMPDTQLYTFYLDYDAPNV